MVTVSVRSESNGAMTVKIAGVLERSAVEKVKKSVIRVIERRPSVSDVTVDLSDLERIDTAGVAMLVFLARTSTIAGRTLRVVYPRDEVTRVLRLVQVEELLMGRDGDVV